MRWELILGTRIPISFPDGLREFKYFPEYNNCFPYKNYINEHQVL